MPDGYLVTVYYKCKLIANFYIAVCIYKCMHLRIKIPSNYFVQICGMAQLMKIRVMTLALYPKTNIPYFEKACLCLKITMAHFLDQMFDRDRTKSKK